MDDLDYQNFLSILHHEVIKFKLESQLDMSMSQAEKDWMKRHGEYIERDIFNKVVAGTKEYHK